VYYHTLHYQYHCYVLNKQCFFSSVTVIAQALSSADIQQDWEWLTKNLLPSLARIESDEDVTEYVCCKISSLVVNDSSSSKDVDGW